MRVLITGADSELGLALVQLTAQREDTVIAGAPTPTPSLNELAEGYGVHLARLDPTQPQGLAAAVRALPVDSLDLLINAAEVEGMGAAHRSLGALTAQALLEAYHANAIWPLMLTQAVLDLLREGEQPRILTISAGSIETKKTGGGYSMAASKSALHALSRALAFDVLRDGIVAICVHPGPITGGPRAELSHIDSARGILRVAATLTGNDAGRYYSWNGRIHPW